MMTRVLFGLAAAAVAATACSAQGAGTSLDSDAPFARATALALAEAEIGGRLSVAQFDDEGRMIYPEDVERWVHIGSSVGLNYGSGEALGDSQIINVATMEPTAYAYFMETGKFADGTMFHLTFHSTVRDERLNSAGFATGQVVATEIHYRDSELFADGFNFFTFATGQTEGAAVPLPNDCVTCHRANAEHEGVFTQFYPALHERLAQGVDVE